ncbi:Hypothetical protein, putative [Bodo saltans]|uniref:Uncharacterized protein n=1 Tax=Bodo saltans TaxID=75058 RepID=A0A0S4KFQ8_BODSA|nr:Hypothetical protein, putative [Bodo saltans]|eukprot:CUI14526.1 Hypothetical protein, putative [Bodo saltans]
MFRGYPKVGLAKVDDLDLTQEKAKGDKGAVKGVDLPAIKRVVVSMSTALRIAKIARDATSTLAVNGTLCGLQVSDTMEVTFAHPHRRMEKSRDDRDKRESAYTEEADPIHLSKNVKELFASEDLDSNMVGQFVAGSLCSKAMLEMSQTLENLIKCQMCGAAAVLLCYDPLAASELGKLNLTAYTFTTEFTAIIDELLAKNAKEGGFLSHTKFPDLVQESKIHEAGIFRAVPVEIQCSELHRMMLHQIELTALPTSRDVAMSGFTEKYLEELLYKMTMTCDQFKNSIGGRARGGEEAKITQILHLDQLKRQTTQLVGLCDSIILHTAITDKVGGKSDE